MPALFTFDNTIINIIAFLFDKSIPFLKKALIRKQKSLILKEKTLFRVFSFLFLSAF